MTTRALRQALPETAPAPTARPDRPGAADPSGRVRAAWDAARDDTAAAALRGLGAFAPSFAPGSPDGVDPSRYADGPMGLGAYSPEVQAALAQAADGFARSGGDQRSRRSECLAARHGDGRAQRGARSGAGAAVHARQDSGQSGCGAGQQRRAVDRRHHSGRRGEGGRGDLQPRMGAVTGRDRGGAPDLCRPAHDRTVGAARLGLYDGQGGPAEARRNLHCRRRLWRDRSAETAADRSEATITGTSPSSAVSPNPLGRAQTQLAQPGIGAMPGMAAYQAFTPQDESLARPSYGAPTIAPPDQTVAAPSLDTFPDAPPEPTRARQIAQTFRVGLQQLQQGLANGIDSGPPAMGGPNFGSGLAAMQAGDERPYRRHGAVPHRTPATASRKPRRAEFASGRRAGRPSTRPASRAAGCTPTTAIWASAAISAGCSKASAACSAAAGPAEARAARAARAERNPAATRSIAIMGAASAPGSTRRTACPSTR